MRNKLAEKAFALSILGVVVDLFIHYEIVTVIAEVAVLAGFILGIVALRQIKKTGEYGKNLALTAVVIGTLGILIVGGAVLYVMLYGTNTP
jgi:Na+/H+-dicarboxylate symporter